MNIPFTKAHANGNDFILVLGENFPENFRRSKNISRLCDRHTGVGADGLFIISSSEEDEFILDYYNADGSWETLCANGSRCAARFMYNQGVVDTKMFFKAGDGQHCAKIIVGNSIAMSMKLPVYKSDCIYVEGVQGYFIDSGARHFVCKSENLDHDYVFNLGRKIRSASVFQPQGINVNFYRFSNDNNLEIKTYEKGVERVMLSCASGSAAVVFHLSKTNVLTSPVTTRSDGGKLSFTFDDGWKNFWSEGPAEFLFNGEFNTKVFN